VQRRKVAPAPAKPTPAFALNTGLEYGAFGRAIRWGGLQPAQELEDGTIQARQALTLMAWGRVAIGGSLLLAPARAGAVWLGKPARSTAGKAAVRAIGGRDLGVGLGTLLAGRRRQPMVAWAAAGALADGSDALATLLSYRELPRITRIPILLGAASTVAAEVAIGLSLLREGDGKQKSAARPEQAPPRHTGRIGTVPG
jgi:hypothetical protein